MQNARAILFDYRQHGRAIWNRFDPAAKTLWYYRALADVFQERSESPLVGELDRTVAELERSVALSGNERPLGDPGE